MEEEVKVGELAQRSGVSVRTLHFYEEVGLLEPSRRTAAGHRVYGLREISRLQQIRSLVQLGFSLEEVSECLRSTRFSPIQLLQLHLSRLEEDLERQRRLRQRLQDLVRHMEAQPGPTANDFLKAIKEMTMLEKHYTPEQLSKLKARAQEVGPERIQQVEGEWRKLLGRVRQEMAKGTDPLAEPILELAKWWQSLVSEFTGGDTGITASLGNLYREDHAAVAEAHGDGVPTPEIFAYMQPALASLGSGSAGAASAD
ncbi:MAG: MerR family transcriptional regulator [Deltaproteobacteria bacterium]|nr:MerR family transcriptional regulator [Deltaproteobacteria bacterium]